MRREAIDSVFLDPVELQIEGDGVQARVWSTSEDRPVLVLPPEDLARKVSEAADVPPWEAGPLLQFTVERLAGIQGYPHRFTLDTLPESTLGQHLASFRLVGARRGEMMARRILEVLRDEVEGAGSVEPPRRFGFGAR
ncbi:MAG: hypothetical protein KC621_31005 [Myxococcales bacterium]|nr:hypothetical protein [Myxococcales bacterium]